MFINIAGHGGIEMLSCFYPYPSMGYAQFSIRGAVGAYSIHLGIGYLGTSTVGIYSTDNIYSTDSIYYSTDIWAFTVIHISDTCYSTDIWVYIFIILFIYFLYSIYIFIYLHNVFSL